MIVQYRPQSTGITWRIPSSDPELASPGITGTSMPDIHNSIIVTESGLVLGAGHGGSGARLGGCPAEWVAYTLPAR